VIDPDSLEGFGTNIPLDHRKASFPRECGATGMHECIGLSVYDFAPYAVRQFAMLRVQPQY
jgi:hypothetical protein